MELMNLNTVKTMSSLEIAKLTGKDHANVLRDIRTVLEDAEIGLISFESSYLNSQNKEQPCFNLPRRECDLVVSGYSVKYRLAIIDRWQELEAEKQNATMMMPNFSNPAEAARAWALQYETAQLAIATKAEIGNRREATAMNTASQAIKKANKLEIELDRSKDYATVKRMQLQYHGVAFNWRLLKSAAQDLGIEPIDTFDQNYGSVKAYHRDVWLEAYALSID